MKPIYCRVTICFFACCLGNKSIGHKNAADLHDAAMHLLCAKVLIYATDQYGVWSFNY